MTLKTARGSHLKIRQIRSGIGFGQDQKATLRALGLGKIGRARIHPDNPQIRGMVGKIPHLVAVEPAEHTGDAAGSQG